MFQITKQHIYRDARDAYFHGGKTQKEIANEVGITARTLRNWINEGCWDRLRQNANIAPAVMLDHFCSQLVQIQEKVASRPAGKRVPKSSEVEKQNKLLNCIIKMKNYPTDMFKTLAYGVNTVSDPLPLASEEEPLEELQMDTEIPLTGRYLAFEGQKEEKIFSEENGPVTMLQEIDNEQYTEAETISLDDENSTKEEKILNKPDTGETKYVPKRNIVLPSGVLWMQKGDIFDPHNDQVRRMTPEEWDILLGLGVGRRDFDGWSMD